MGWKKQKCSFRPLSQWVKLAPTWRSCSGCALALARSLGEREKHLHGAPCQARQYFFLMPSRRYKLRATATNGSESSSGSSNGYIEDSITRSNQISSAHRVSCRFLKCTFCASLEFYTLFLPEVSAFAIGIARNGANAMYVLCALCASTAHSQQSVNYNMFCCVFPAH